MLIETHKCSKCRKKVIAECSGLHESSMSPVPTKALGTSWRTGQKECPIWAKKWQLTVGTGEDVAVFREENHWKVACALGNILLPVLVQQPWLNSAACKYHTCLYTHVGTHRAHTLRHENERGVTGKKGFIRKGEWQREIREERDKG